MPKYQIILSTAEIMSDQEFEERVKTAYNIPSYLVIEARSLEGIRPEAYLRHVDGTKESVKIVDISDLL